jgi:hypothetical protein
MPRITAETVSDAVGALTPNSPRSTGSTGWVIYTVVKAAATKEKTKTCKVKKFCCFMTWNFGLGGTQLMRFRLN